MNRSCPGSVVLADDDVELAMAARMMLEDAGYAVRTASAGAAALRLCHDSVPDVLVMDVNMPGELDGWQAAEKARSSPALAPVPIILMSGTRSAPTDARVRSLGITEVLRKPFTVPDLLAAVGRACDADPGR